MTPKKKSRFLSLGIVLVMAVVIFAGTTVANAQDREGRWEFNLGVFNQFSSNVDVKEGYPIDVDNSFGFEMGGGYNFTDMLAVDFGFQWNRPDYDTTVLDDNNQELRLSGSYDSFTFSANLIVNLADGPWVPYIGGGIGYTWIDTNIPNGPPGVNCWWDPWYGWVCYGSYPTKNTDAFSYQLLLGLRYEFPNNTTFLRFAYTSQWMDFSKTSGTPRFDVISFDFGWMF